MDIASPPSLTIIVPTWNESKNLPILYGRIREVLADWSWKIIVVDDDSQDRTWEVAECLALEDARVSVIRRIGRSGLTSACIEGLEAADTDLCAVIDADLQHDEALLPKMVQEFIQSEQALDLVVGSRRVDNASYGDMPKIRVFVSEVARKLTNLAVRSELSDPMSGYFMVRRTTFKQVRAQLYGRGFKILLDLCAASRSPLTIKELPYTMRARHAGESKLSMRVIFELIAFLLYQLVGKRLAIPARFIKFCLVGFAGVAVHMSCLFVLHKLMGWSFLSGQIAATLLAMCGNFFLNNIYTFKEHSLSGRKVWKGLLSFIMLCSIGSLIGVAVSTFLNEHGLLWWLAAFVSILISAIWNFSVNTIFTWRVKVG